MSHLNFINKFNQNLKPINMSNSTYQYHPTPRSIPSLLYTKFSPEETNSSDIDNEENKSFL